MGIYKLDSELLPPAQSHGCTLGIWQYGSFLGICSIPGSCDNVSWWFCQELVVTFSFQQNFTHRNPLVYLTTANTLNDCSEFLNAHSKKKIVKSFSHLTDLFYGYYNLWPLWTGTLMIVNWGLTVFPCKLTWIKPSINCHYQRDCNLISLAKKKKNPTALEARPSSWAVCAHPCSVLCSSLLHGIPWVKT